MKPTDDTIALVGLLLGGGWLYADEVRHALVRFGFEMPSSQWIAGRLTAMTKESSPRFALQESYGGAHEYRVTSWAVTGLSNVWPGFTPPRGRDLPTPFPKLATPQSQED